MKLRGMLVAAVVAPRPGGLLASAGLALDAVSLLEARDLIGRFHTLVRAGSESRFDEWIEEASVSLIASFAQGIARDRDAVRAAITEQWSNGQTLGQITKLKLVS